MIQLDKTNYVFLKAVSSEYADNFFNKGEIFFNTIGYYQDLEKNNDNIGDRMENVILNIPIGTFQFIPEIISDSTIFNDIKKTEDVFKSSPKIPFENLHGVRKNYNDVVHCLCFSSIKIMDDGEQMSICIDPHFIERFSGSQFYLIHDTQDYINRIYSELKKIGCKAIKSGLVEYYKEEDEIIHLYGDPFKKSERFKYQNEFRIFVQKSTSGPLTINIGSLSDIAIDVTNLLGKITPKNTDE